LNYQLLKNFKQIFKFGQLVSEKINNNNNNNICKVCEIVKQIKEMKEESHTKIYLGFTHARLFPVPIQIRDYPLGS